MSNHLSNRAALAAGLLSLGLATGAGAASAPFLHLPFAPGEVADRGHEGWIDAHSVQWGGGRPGCAHQRGQRRPFRQAAGF